MISQIYTLIGEAFENGNYIQVVKLVDKALEIPEFGFNMNLLYKYGYSLLMVRRKKDGVRILKVILENDTNPHVLEKTREILKSWKKNQAIKLPIELYLSKGHKLQEGLAVYVRPDAKIESEIPLSEGSVSYLYLIWKIENDKIYAFPLKKYTSHGHILKAYKYFRKVDLAAVPKLVSFDVDSIMCVSMKLDTNDYVDTIKDLYERYCIFGTISCNSKNYFVQEKEKSLSINIGDIVAIYDPATRSKLYYSIIDIDTEQSIYRAFRIGHLNGELCLKGEYIEEIPFSTYIMEKTIISFENQTHLKEAISKWIDANRRR